MTVRFKTKRADFSPNLEDLRIQHVTLFFALTDGPALTITVDHLLLFPTDGGPPLGGSGSTTDGLISTRRGSLPGLLGKEPIGEWELALPDTPTTRGWFANERITDILLVITYEGDAPSWPA